MKKLSLLWLSAVAVGTMFFTACNGGDETDPAPVTQSDCDKAVYDFGTGTATIKILNTAGDAFDVEAGKDVYLSISIKKGTERTQKLRLYSSDCKKLVGTLVDVAGDKNNRIDLRATDNEQVKNIKFTVPASAPSVMYLTIEVDEKGDKFTRKQVTLNLKGSGLINSYDNMELGGNSNTTSGPNKDGSSRLASSTGYVFSACDVAANLDFIDITYAVSKDAGNQSYICSNPARFTDAVSKDRLSSTAKNCGDIAELKTDGGQKVSYKKSTLTAADFASATNASLAALTITTTDPEYVAVKEGGEIFEFVNALGKKGLIKVESVSQINNSAGFITVSVKVQR